MARYNNMVSKQLECLQTKLTVAHNNYNKMLYVHAYIKVNDQMLSEDLVQQAFMKAWIYLVKKGDVDLMKAFLYHVLNNLIVDEYRKHKATSLDTIMEKGFEPRARGDPESLANFIDGKKAMLLINKLPEKYKKIMQMRYIKSLSPEDIHLITGQSKNSVTVQAHRGLKKLRILYNQEPVK